jgi:hypothetical protein
MGRRFCPGGVIVSTLRAICAELGIGAHCRPHRRHPQRLYLISPEAAWIPGAWTRCDAGWNCPGGGPAPRG